MTTHRPEFRTALAQVIRTARLLRDQYRAEARAAVSDSASASWLGYYADRWDQNARALRDAIHR